VLIRDLLPPTDTAATKIESWVYVVQLGAVNILGVCGCDFVNGSGFASLAARAAQSVKTGRLLFLDIVGHDPFVGHEHAPVILSAVQAAEAALHLFSFRNLCYVMHTGKRNFAFYHQGS
jgi:hypothetical protein